MKIINYKYGWREQFQCVIHGRIVMSRTEWILEVLPYLRRSSVIKRINRSAGWYSLGFLRDDIKRSYLTKQGVLLNIRVSPTEAVVKRFKPAGMKYKRGNYEILITP